MSYYNKSCESTLNELNTNALGLSKIEVDKRQLLHGENALPKQKKQSRLMKFLSQFKDIMVIILLIAAIISVVVAIVDKNYSDLFEGGVIFFIVILNAIIGTIQESKAEDALESLKKSTEPYCKVLRDGKVKKIKTTSLTIGDIVILEAGDIVPADLRLIETHNLKCDESALTGESVSTSKEANCVLKDNTPLADRINCAYSSTVVSFGRGKGVVTEIGINTEIGKIAKYLNTTNKDLTPLEKSIKKVGKIITIAVLIIAVVIFLVEIFLADTIDILNAFLVSVTLAVAAIPESLPAVITIIMAIGLQNLAKRGAIVKRLKAVETLGSCEVICSDKTGTLTQNKMEIVKFSSDLKIYQSLKDDQDAKILVNGMILCNDSFIGENEKVVGDPTEVALLEFAIKNKLDIKKIRKDNKRIYELPFDSDRKLMSTVNIYDNNSICYTKGAYDNLIKKCKYILINGKVEKLNNSHITKLTEINEEMSSKALRVLAFAYKTVSNDFSDLEEDLIFSGLVGMIDPPRPEVKTAIEKCKTAGLKPIMITGDHPDTAYAIAKELNIATNKKQVITGEKLDKINEEQLINLIQDFNMNNLLIVLKSFYIDFDEKIKNDFERFVKRYSINEIGKNADFSILKDDINYSSFELILNNFAYKILNFKDKIVNINIYDFFIIFDGLLDEFNCVKRLNDKIDELFSKNILKFKQYTQIEEKIKSVKENICEFYAEEFKLEKLSYFLKLCFENTTISVPPPSVDSVFVGEVQGSYFIDCKKLYIIGANSANFPCLKKDVNLFLDNEFKLILF